MLSTFRSTRHTASRAAALVLGVVSLAMMASACTGDAQTAPSSTASTTTPTSTTTAPSTSSSTTPTSTTVPAAASMRGDRYCEVLLPRPSADGITVEVYNSYRLNECPADVWSSLDATVVAAEQGTPLAVLNGPRYWLMDRVQKQQEAGGFTVVDFGGIRMNLLATVSIASVQAASVPYTPNAVDRSTVFTYDAGSTVYELTSSTGERFVMQSWSQQVDPTLEERDLEGLGERLTLPDGWSYSSRVLDAPLDLATVDAPAQVLQDDFRNSYSLVV